MDPVLSYNFAEIEYTVRQEIHGTSARLNAALDDLRTQIVPLQQVGRAKLPRRTDSNKRNGIRPRPH